MIAEIALTVLNAVCSSHSPSDTQHKEQVMKDGEDVAEKYLHSIGYTDAVYEPDGNVPPDFGIGNRIAVEVRVLMSIVNDGGEISSSRTTAIPVNRLISSVLRDFGPPTDDQSWFITYRLRKRPIPPAKQFERELKDWLHSFLTNPIGTPETICITDSVELELRPAVEKFPEMFMIGMYTDRSEGGFVVAQMKELIEHAMQEKAIKVANYVKGYDQWWLALVDKFSFGMPRYDQEQLKELVTRSAPWDKVLILDPGNINNTFEI